MIRIFPPSLAVNSVISVTDMHIFPIIDSLTFLQLVICLYFAAILVVESFVTNNGQYFQTYTHNAMLDC